MDLQRLSHLAFYCHRRPDRSFHLRGRPLPLCARCTGILVGYAAGPLLFMGGLQLGLAALVGWCLPLVIDGTGQLQGRWESTNVRRLITGLAFGAAVTQVGCWSATLGFRWGEGLGARIVAGW
jgi:uncharacterized membrane protein